MYPGTKISIHDSVIPEPTNKVTKSRDEILNKGATNCRFGTESEKPYITKNKYLVDN